MEAEEDDVPQWGNVPPQKYVLADTVWLVNGRYCL